MTFYKKGYPYQSYFAILQKEEGAERPGTFIM